MKSKVPEWFLADGCTCYPDGPRRKACEFHDWEYWLGGTDEDKRKADVRLYENVKRLGGANRWFHCYVMYAGVRLFARHPFQYRTQRLSTRNVNRLEKKYKKERFDDWCKQCLTSN